MADKRRQAASERPPDGVVVRHRLYEETLESRFPFVTRLQPGSGRPTWEFELAAAGRARPDPAKLAQLFASPYLTAGGEPAVELYGGGGGVELLRFTGCCDFVLEAGRIVAHLDDPAAAPLVELRLLGPVLAYLLERGGLVVLHGSAVVWGGRAVAFAGGNRAGKTGLAAALMERSARLLTDDLLAIESRGGIDRVRAGPPEMRMWPDAAARFAGSWRQLQRVLPTERKRRLPVGGDGFGGLHPRPAELAALLLPQRREAAAGAAPELSRLAPAAALKAVLGQSYSPLLVEAVGWRARRLAALAEIVGRLPVFELWYDGGLDRIGEVAEAVECRLRTL